MKMAKTDYFILKFGLEMRPIRVFLFSFLVVSLGLAIKLNFNISKVV